MDTGRLLVRSSPAGARVLVDGKEWAAELEDAAELAAGADVQVTRVLTGARLRVKPA